MNLKYAVICINVASLLCVATSLNETVSLITSEPQTTTTATTTTETTTLPTTTTSTTTKTLRKTTTATTTETTTLPTTTMATTTIALPTATTTTTTTPRTSTTRTRTSQQRGGVTSMITTEISQRGTNSSFDILPLMTAKGRSLSTRPTQLHGPHLLPNEAIFQVVHTCLTVLALTCNCVSLMVIYGVVPKLTPPLRLLTSLAFCDMLAPWAIMTLYFSRSACQDEIHTSVLLAAHNASALTLISLALIHNVATFRPLHYERIASSRNIWTVVGVVWVMSTLLAHVHFFVSIFDRSHNAGDLISRSVTVSIKNTTISPSFTSPTSFLTTSSPIGPTYCERIESSTSIALIISGFLCLLAVLSGVAIYARILLHLRPVDAFLTPQSNTTSSGGEGGTRGRGVMTSSRHSTRGVLTGVVLLAGYALTWLPYLVVKYVSVEVSMSDYASTQISSSSDVAEGGLTDDAAVQVAVGVCQALLIVGCLVNPVVCGCRMTCLQLGYSRLLVRCRVGCVRAWMGCRRRIKRYRGDDDEVPTTPLNQISESLCY